ncbi:hypothetical protein [Nesterenkonia aerolata]|uniref:Acetone carboxylase n=1 Tax=Nesterenkonia aerolata TaxID=3074079 RepID=A0ABU2DUR8_9MICC|nr:hypothetical protein [Nesterenkonia sp. LY-0111]MDR8020249.1 hypothetical protein [Nesterenkonia sp. LY-0111]
MDLLRSLESEEPSAGPTAPQCSRKGCRAAAAWQILWNNPKIHAPERRKVWLACEEHRQWLEHFLRQRLFWRSTEPMVEATQAEGTQPDGPRAEGAQTEGAQTEGNSAEDDRPGGSRAEGAETGLTGDAGKADPR